MDYQANVNTIDILKFAMDMKNENEFMNGLQEQLVPWMDKGEKVTNVSLDKPKSFEEARETEKQCVFFAKDVRKANKMLAASNCLFLIFLHCTMLNLEVPSRCNVKTNNA